MTGKSLVILLAVACLALAASSAFAADISISTFNSDADGWTTSVWHSGTYTYDWGSMGWFNGAINGGGMVAGGAGGNDNDAREAREMAAIEKTISTAGYANVQFSYAFMIGGDGLGVDFTDSAGSGELPPGSTGCDHGLIEEQLTVSYSTNGGANWVECESTPGKVKTWLDPTVLNTAKYGAGGAKTRSINLSSVGACDNNANFMLKFRYQMNNGRYPTTLTGEGSWDKLFLDDIKVTGTVIPEPSALLALATGAIGLAGAIRRRRR